MLLRKRQRRYFYALARKSGIARKRINTKMISDVIHADARLSLRHRDAHAFAGMPETMGNTSNSGHDRIRDLGWQTNFPDPRRHQNIIAICNRQAFRILRVYHCRAPDQLRPTKFSILMHPRIIAIYNTSSDQGEFAITAGSGIACI